MLDLPRRRLYVYVVAGLVVLAVGTTALIAWRGGSSEASPVVVIGSSGPETEPAGTVLEAPSSQVSPVTASTMPTVTTTETVSIYVQVTGAVRYPGVYQVALGTRVFEAVSRAGGFTEDADPEAIALAVEVTDGCRIHVPRLGETAPDAVVAPQVSSVGVKSFASSEEQAAGGPEGVLSLNTATAQELESLPGIGPALAQRIIAYRETNGPFTSVDQLGEVPGIGPARLEQLRPLVGL